MEHAKQIVANGIKYYIEVANMPTTNDALFYLIEQKNMIVAPSKARQCRRRGRVRAGDEPEQRAPGLVC